MSFFFLHHPTEADLALFAGGEAGPLARWRIERHLDLCGSCRDVVADFFHLQSDLGGLAEVPRLDWDAFARQIKAAAAQAESPAAAASPGETDRRESWFGRPAAWGVGLASATAVCGFVVFQQFSQDASTVETAIFSDAPKREAFALAEEASGDRLAKESAVRSISAAQAVDELEEGLSAAPAEQVADTFEFVDAPAPLDANKRTAENVGPQSRLFAAQDDDSAPAAADAEKVLARVAADTPAETKQRQNVARNVESFERDRESDLRADVVSATGDKRSVSAAALRADSQRKGGRQIAGGALASASEARDEEDRDRVGREIPSAVRVVSAGERAAEPALTKTKSREQHAEKAAVVETEYETVSADVTRQKRFARNAPPTPAPPARRQTAEQPPELRAALEKSEALGAFRGGAAELRRAIGQTAAKGDAKDETSQRVYTPELSLLPAGMRYEEAEIGVAADGSMSIRTLDSTTNTVTITHVYLP